MPGLTAAIHVEAAARAERRRLLVLLGALYVAQGIPMGFAFEAVPVLLRQAGVPLETIALVPLAGLPWILKLLWAPLVDNRAIGGLGRRRGWMLCMQAALAASFLAMAALPFAQSSAPALVALLAFGTVAAATQDTATDGMAAEHLNGAALAQANALQTGGMMVGFMAGGAGTLLAAEAAGPRAALLLMAALLALALLPVLPWREGPPAREAPRRASLLAGLRRPGVGRLLLVALFYGTAHAGGMSLSKLLLVDRGWSGGDIGLATLATSLGMILLGCPLGARLTNHLGLWRAMAAGLLVALLTLVAWALTAVSDYETRWEAALGLSLLLGIASGVIAVAANTLAMRFAAAGGQAGTDVALLQSANILGEMLAAGLLVWSAVTLGYGGAFLLGAGVVVGILGVVRWAAATVSAAALAARP